MILALIAAVSLTVRGTAPGDVVLLFHPSQDAPISSAETVLRRVPAGEAIVCAIGATDTRCALVGEASDTVDFESVPRGDVRVFHAEPQRGNELAVLARGNVAIRPKKIAAMTVSSGPWTAITLPSPARWEDVVVDRTGDELALQRIPGPSLPLLPAFATLFPTRERGIVVQPSIGPKKRSIDDRDAMLVVFPEKSEIPLATAGPDEDGRFAFPSLAAGKYEFKLLSSVSTADRVTANANVGAPLEVTFASGPTITGRVVRTSGGTAEDPIVIEAAPVATLQELASGDPIDRIRFTRAGDDGAFTLVLATPGRYTLRARWGAASAERDFEIAPKTQEVALGDIPLTLGATLRGSLAGCASGEALVLPVPDAAKPLATVIGDPRRTAIAADGRFVVEGLAPGAWSILVKCDGVIVAATPEVFAMPAEGDAVIEFQRAALH